MKTEEPRDKRLARTQLKATLGVAIASLGVPVAAQFRMPWCAIGWGIMFAGVAVLILALWKFKKI